MPDERERRMLERAAFEKGWDARGMRGSIRRGFAKCLDAEYPLPAAKAWRCKGCGSTFPHDAGWTLDAYVDWKGKISYTHVDGRDTSMRTCGPVEEVEE